MKYLVDERRFITTWVPILSALVVTFQTVRTGPLLFLHLLVCIACMHPLLSICECFLLLRRARSRCCCCYRCDRCCYRCCCRCLPLHVRLPFVRLVLFGRPTGALPAVGPCGCLHCLPMRPIRPRMCCAALCWLHSPRSVHLCARTECRRLLRLLVARRALYCCRVFCSSR